LSNLTPLLSVYNLSYQTPDRRPLVSDLNFSIKPGDLLAVTGANGVGKSTLLQVIIGNMQPTTGSIKVQTKALSFLSQLHNREFHIPLTIQDVISFSNQNCVGTQSAVDIGLLEPHELTLAWNSASGGERQKALLTQALLTDAELLILDEPMNHLDSSTRKKLMVLLANLADSKKKGVLIVCHEQILQDTLMPSTQTLDLSRYNH